MSGRSRHRRARPWKPAAATGVPVQAKHARRVDLRMNSSAPLSLCRAWCGLTLAGRNQSLLRAAVGIGADGHSRSVPEEATMEEHFVWMTTRQIKPGTLTDFERGGRPDRHPGGMLRACGYWSEDEREVVGVSVWISQGSCDAWRASEAEARRREAMAGYVLGEQEGFYRGRELHVPDH